MRRTYGYQIGHVGSTRFGVFHFMPPEALPDVETAIERLVFDLLLPLAISNNNGAEVTGLDDLVLYQEQARALTCARGSDARQLVADSLFDLARGGLDPDRHYEKGAVFDQHALITLACELDWQFGKLFADEVMQSADSWVRRGLPGYGCVYTRGVDRDRAPRAFTAPGGS